MSKKKTHEEYVQELLAKNPNVLVAEKYINMDTPTLHYCTSHDEYWKTTPYRALQGVGCKECKKEKFRQTRCKTQQQYIKEVETINTNIIVVGQYIDAKTPIKHYCKTHDIFWDTLPDNILHGCGCVECGKDKIGNKNKKSHNEYITELEKINPNVEVMEEYIDANTAILHMCKIDGHKWYARPGNILFGKGCPQCNESHGEKQIRQWLDNHYIKYITQKTFDDCKNRRVLPFDFYISDYNLCIEYDGEQHYRPVDFFGGDERFQQCQYHDTIKTKYCKDNNIHLLRIPYFKNIEEELRAFFIHLI